VAFFLRRNRRGALDAAGGFGMQAVDAGQPKAYTDLTRSRESAKLKMASFAFFAASRDP